MPRYALLLVLAVVGCAATTADVPRLSVTDEPTVRGQGPSVIEGAPWGPSYLEPGELSCDTPPPIGIGYEVVGPSVLTTAPGLAAPTAPPQAVPEAGLFDVLPPDGGPISDDFGLPRRSRIENRVPNPLYVRVGDPDAAWEVIAREASRYFPIRAEQRVTQSGAVLTEGRIETQWGAGSTIFEPWRRDSAGAFNRWQSTLQSIRRRALVRVIPASGGYEIDVRVDKQLEDLNRPERASTGAASIRNDAALPTDRVTPIDRVRESDRWIDLGRDEALEQRILKRLRGRFAA